MKFLNRLKRLKLNFLALVGNLDARSQKLAEEAGRIWVEAAIQKVPAWSGASLATFEQLASVVGVNVPINVSPTAPDRIALGRLNGRGGIERVTKGHWRFFYENNLEYLSANETRQVGVGEYGVRWGLLEPTPYNFREAGNEAVDRFLKKAELPRIEITEV